MSVDPVIREGLELELSAAIAAHDGPVEAIVPDGDPGTTLVEASQQADLLAVGSRGHGRLRSALLGSVSHHVMRHAVCPVVILPPGAGADQESAVRDAAVWGDGE
jgi:nucleotide-binding universal stress UspA family protein